MSLEPDTPSAPPPPVLSLLVCTKGRSAPLERLFDSLAAQTCRDFEVVLVDQNAPGVLAPVVARYRDRLAIDHVRSAPGLSRARNVGLARCRGDLIAFPDDDCWYPAGLTAEVVRLFSRHPEADAVTGRTLDGAGVESLGAFLAADQPVDRRNVWFAGNSNALFVRRAAARAVGGFDETLGVGAPTPFRSGEETDFLLRLLGQGRGILFRHGLVVHHDQVGLDANRHRRAADYARGFGRVLRLHRYGLVYLGFRLARFTASGGRALLRRDAGTALDKALWAIGTVAGYCAARPGAVVAGE
ncbi:glycosyltransferase family 2 protein [Methylobacterium nonmethylotrophicum]|uniref:Glycosyltransferase family 2 protein n=1 Tax=Methylobacterium nonmethylotrophicum TaxID=1141884 RepID=A0A4Z0NUD8_9HYPH|nr:glycosyltransferase family A protein [Methylobacterium nonmethylotrophicum]TGE00815.1 glycosyltransferase family 2 protein [Methylobacterium nonmethylotrophicum]